MKNLISIFTVALTLLSALPAFSQHRSKEEMARLVPLTPHQEKSAGIKTVEPQTTKFESTLFCIGSIQVIPNRHTVVSSRIAGRVITAPPIVGDTVKAGDTIVKIESRQPGSPPPVIPVNALKGGVIFESHVKLGQPVEPSQELMDIVDISKLWAIANVPESQAHRVKIGQKARIRVTSLGEQVFHGELIKFGTEADSQSGTVQAIFLIDNANLKLRPNMRTEFSIVTKVREKVLSVPKSAIQGDRLNAHVFRKDGELKHTYEKVPVITGEENDQFVEIIKEKKGITIIDDVVIEGGYLLSHAGSGNKASLKEYLDAAHGHEHNEDGTEMTAEQKAAKEKEKQAKAGGSKNSGWVIPLIVSNGILLVLLIFTILRKGDVS